MLFLPREFATFAILVYLGVLGLSCPINIAKVANSQGKIACLAYLKPSGLLSCVKVLFYLGNLPLCYVGVKSSKFPRENRILT